jgi:hypothetical protein
MATKYVKVVKVVKNAQVAKVVENVQDVKVIENVQDVKVIENVQDVKVAKDVQDGPPKDFIEFVKITAKRTEYDAFERRAHDFKEDSKSPVIFHKFASFVANSFEKKTNDYKNQIKIMADIANGFDKVSEYPFVAMYSDNICNISSVMEKAEEWSNDLEKELEKGIKALLNLLETKVNEYKLSKYSCTDYADTKTKLCMICCANPVEIAFHTNVDMHLIYCKKCHEKDLKRSPACPLCRVNKAPFAHIKSLKLGNDDIMSCVPKGLYAEFQKYRISQESKMCDSDSDILEKMSAMFEKGIESIFAHIKDLRNKDTGYVKIICGYVTVCSRALMIATHDYCKRSEELKSIEIIYTDAIIQLIEDVKFISNMKIKDSLVENFMIEFQVIIGALICWKKNVLNNNEPRELVPSLNRKRERLQKFKSVQ